MDSAMDSALVPRFSSSATRAERARVERDFTKQVTGTLDLYRASLRAETMSKHAKLESSRFPVGDRAR